MIVNFPTFHILETSVHRMTCLQTKEILIYSLRAKRIYKAEVSANRWSVNEIKALVIYYNMNFSWINFYAKVVNDWWNLF